MYPWLVAVEEKSTSRNFDKSTAEVKPSRSGGIPPVGAGDTHVDVSTCRIVDVSVLGFAKASPHKGRCAYAWSAEISVYIHPNHHGKGIGKALYSRLVPMLREQRYTTLIAGITIPNPASQRLHESFGFTRAATFHRIGWKFDRWHDVGYWELMLRDGEGQPPKVRLVTNVWQE
jgi:phosphinothricin acetyltransferase